MKKFKPMITFVLSLAILFSSVPAPFARAESAETYTITDYLFLEEKELQNGEICMWTGFDGKGIYLNAGDEIFFQVQQTDDKYYSMYSHMEQYIYQWNERNNQFSLSQTLVSSSSVSSMLNVIYYGKVPSSGYYAFGTRNFNLRPAYVTGFVYKQDSE